MMNKGEERVVHIFPQPDYHDDAVIIGNKRGLLSLKAAIEKALENGKGNCILMPSDGENYECIVLMNEEDWQAPYWQKMKGPYAELLDDSPDFFGPNIYAGYGLSKTEDIPDIEKSIERDKKISEEWTNKIKEAIERKNSTEE